MLRTLLENMRRDFEFEVDETDLPQRPRYNIAPTQLVSVIRLIGGRKRHSFLTWGLIPSWSNGPGERPLINARGESIAEKPSFKDAFRRRRCLVLADGFYEWQKHQGRTSQPYFIQRPDGRVFAMGGIWERWIAPTGEVIETVAIVTTETNGTLRHIHDRMPVTLSPADYMKWLDVDRVSVEEAQKLIKPAPDDFFVAHPIGTRVNAVVNDDADIIKPATATPPPKPERPKKEPPKDDTQGSLF